MKYILEIIIILITITCFSFLMEYKHETSNLKAKLNQTNSILHKLINNDTTLNKSVLTQEFKEDYYITQQQLNQDQVIGFVTLLFAIIAIVGAGIFSYVLVSFNQNIKDDYTIEHNKQQQLIHEAHKELNYIGYHFADNIINTSNVLINIDLAKYIYYSLHGITLYKYYGYKLGEKEIVNKIILKSIQDINNNIKTKTSINENDRTIIWNFLSKLTSINDIELLNEISKLQAKINDQ